MLNILDRDARQQAATSLMSEQSHLREEQWDGREEALRGGEEDGVLRERRDGARPGIQYRGVLSRRWRIHAWSGPCGTRWRRS